MNGSIGNATIAAGGTSSIIIAGLNVKADVNLAGTASIFLGVTSGDLPSLHLKAYSLAFHVQPSFSFMSETMYKQHSQFHV